MLQKVIYDWHSGCVNLFFQPRFTGICQWSLTFCKRKLGFLQAFGVTFIAYILEVLVNPVLLNTLYGIVCEPSITFCTPVVYLIAPFSQYVTHLLIPFVFGSGAVLNRRLRKNELKHTLKLSGIHAVNRKVLSDLHDVIPLHIASRKDVRLEAKSGIVILGSFCRDDRKV